MKNKTVALSDKETIHGHRPVNSLSARVVSTVYENVPEVSNKTCSVRSKDRLPTTQFIGRRQDDITGRRKGSLTVIGMFLRQNRNDNAAWVVRCYCGYYETRKARAIKNPYNYDDCCHGCQYVKRMNRNNHFNTIISDAK